MLTGDSLLTALHTARECLIIGGRSSADEISLECSGNSKLRDGESDRDRDRDREGDRNKGCGIDITESKVLVLSVSNREGDNIAPKGQEGHALPAMEHLVWKDEEGNTVYKYCSDVGKNYSGGRPTDISTDGSSNDSEHLDDDSLELVGLSARELSSLGGFDLVTSGDAIALLCTRGPGHPNGDMDELRYFKVIHNLMSFYSVSQFHSFQPADNCDLILPHHLPLLKIIISGVRKSGPRDEEHCGKGIQECG